MIYIFQDYRGKENEIKKLLNVYENYFKASEKYQEFLKEDNEYLKIQIKNIEESKRKSRKNLPLGIKRKVFKKFGKCISCGIKENLQVDHIIPISDGGSDEINNLQILCYKCHKQKHSKKE